jgi:chromosome segregation ATPase
LKESLSKKDSELNAKLKDASSSFARERDSLQRRLDSLSGQLKETEELLAKLKEKDGLISSLEEKVSSLDRDRSSLEEKLAAAKKDIESLEIKLVSQTQGAQDAAKAADALKASTNELQAQVASLTKSKADAIIYYESELKNVAKAKASLEEALKATEADKASLAEKLMTQSNGFQRLTVTVDELRSANQELQRQVASLKESVANKDRRVNFLNSQLKEAIGRLQQISGAGEEGNQ